MLFNLIKRVVLKQNSIYMDNEHPKILKKRCKKWFHMIWHKLISSRQLILSSQHPIFILEMNSLYSKHGVKMVPHDYKRRLSRQLILSSHPIFIVEMNE